MNYWLYITTFNNWKITKETNILGVSEKHRNMLSRLKVGDTCLVYLMRSNKKTPVRIVAEYLVTSKIFDDNSRIFKAPTKAPSETFNVRVRLKPLNVFKHPIEFSPLVSQLGFITNQEKYSLDIRGKAIIEIPQEDYKLITSQAS